MHPDKIKKTNEWRRICSKLSKLLERSTRDGNCRKLGILYVIRQCLGLVVAECDSAIAVPISKQGKRKLEQTRGEGWV